MILPDPIAVKLKLAVGGVHPGVKSLRISVSVLCHWTSIPRALMAPPSSAMAFSYVVPETMYLEVTVKFGPNTEAHQRKLRSMPL
jgi:hypothetical protein